MKYRIGLILLTTAFALSNLAILQKDVDAVSASDWKAGNIIDDFVFTDKASMSTAQIQSFLDKRLRNCDPNGTQRSELGGGTRAQYGAAHGNPAPFTCLNKYYEVPKTSPGKTIPASNYGGKAIPKGAKSAAQLIYDAARTYSISPKVLLVKLGTESAGPLTSDTWPFKSQYTYAMGAHCPDSGPGGSANCDVNYSGFSLQMREAASLMRWYLDSMDESWWSYKKPHATNYILWNVEPSGCKGSNVYIENKATAALYTYTPYQPNKAALNNMYATGDKCSAYGNRNFWRVYNDWFGNTHGTIQVSDITMERQPFTDKSVTVSFSITNRTRSTVDLGKIKIAARDPDNMNTDFEQVDNVKLAPNQSYTYRKSQVLGGPEGSYRFFIARYSASMWHYPAFDDFGQATDNAITRYITKQPTLTTPLTLTTNSQDVHANQLITASFKVKNNSSKAINIGYIKPAVRDSSNRNFDFPYSDELDLSPGQTYTYSASRSLPSKGNYKVWIANRRDGYDWSETFPASATPTVLRNVTLSVKDSVLLMSSISISMPNMHAGNTVTASFTVKNFSTNTENVGYVKPAVRDSKNTNLDFPFSPYLRLAPGESYTYNQSRVLPKADIYKVWIANRRDGYDWSETFPASDDASLRRRLDVSVMPPAVLDSPLTVTMNTPTSGSTATASFTIKNYGTKTENVGYVKPAVRDSKNTNLDFPFSPYLRLAPGESYTYNQSRVLPKADIYKVWIANRRDGYDWSETFPASDDAQYARKLSFDIRNTARVTTALSIVTSGSTATASFTIKNYGTKTENVGYVKPAVRDSKNTNLDFPFSPYLRLAPGESYTYNQSRVLPSGDFTVWIANKRDGYGWSETYPTSENSSLSRNGRISVD